MQISQVPALLPKAFAASGTKNTIPVDSQISVTPGAASLTDGFPPLTMTPLAAGGVPPYGADINGILNWLSQICQWSNAGGAYPYDAAFSTAIGGYPKYAVLPKASGNGYWLCLADNTTTDPDTGGSGWADSRTLTYGVDAGSANTVQANFPVPVATLVDGMAVQVKIAAANTGVTTFTPNPGVISAAPVVGAAHQPLQGGELVIGGRATFIWRADVSTWVLTECTGGAIQVSPATQSQHAVQMGQVSGVVGQSRNLAMDVTAASATAMLTADEIIVESALGGLRYCLGNFNQTINLATVGAGGMDTGGAPTSGFVALYAIYNPSTGARALLGVNATSILAPEVYGGANMPAGYTASALVSVWQVNASGQFGVASQRGREYMFGPATVLSTSVQTASLTALSVAALVPKNARYVRGSTVVATSTSGSAGMQIASNTSGSCRMDSALTMSSSGSFNSWFSQIAVLTTQTVYYNFNGAGTVTLTLQISGYTI